MMDGKTVRNNVEWHSKIKYIWYIGASGWFYYRNIPDISEKDELSNMFNCYVYIVNVFFGLISVLTENTVTSSYEEKSRRDIINAYTSFNAKVGHFQPILKSWTHRQILIENSHTKFYDNVFGETRSVHAKRKTEGIGITSLTVAFRNPFAKTTKNSNVVQKPSTVYKGEGGAENQIVFVPLLSKYKLIKSYIDLTSNYYNPFQKKKSSIFHTKNGLTSFPVPLRYLHLQSHSLIITTNLGLL